MSLTLMLAGRNALLQEALEISLNNNGYKVFRENGKLPIIESSIEEKSPDIVVWDDTIIPHSFERIFELSKSPAAGAKSVLILDSDMLVYMAEGLLNGVKGFVHKNNGITEFKSCLSAVQNDKVFISPKLSGKIELNFITDQSEFDVKELTERETEILRLVKEGHTSKEISDLLHISHRTVQNHRQNICNKLGLSGRNKLYDYAKFYFNSNGSSDSQQ